MNDNDIRAALLNFWTSWASRSNTTVEDAMRLIYIDFNRFGTNIEENWKSKEDLRSQLLKEIVHVPEGCTFDIHWTHVLPQNNGYYLLITL